MFNRSNHHNPWKGFAVGALGGIAGIAAMAAYWAAVQRITGHDPRGTGADDEDDPQHALDDISLVGQQHRQGESSTAAMGRIAYRAVMGQPPSPQTKTLLSYLIHYAIGMGMSGLYGALRAHARPPDPVGGLLLGTGLWLLGDELLMPALGLTDGPTAYSAELHAHGAGAHLAYGLASAAATQVLDELL